MPGGFRSPLGGRITGKRPRLRRRWRRIVSVGLADRAEKAPHALPPPKRLLRRRDRSPPPERLLHSPDQTAVPCPQVAENGRGPRPRGLPALTGRAAPRRPGPAP